MGLRSFLKGLCTSTPTKLSLANATSKLRESLEAEEVNFWIPITKLCSLLQQGTSRHRIILQISHAQYDGIALSTIWQRMAQFYNGNDLERLSFVDYLNARRFARTTKTYQYWRELLEGSRMTEIVSDRADHHQTRGWTCH